MTIPEPAARFARLRAVLTWIAPPEGRPIEAWRRRILAAALLGILGFGFIAYVPSVYFAVQAGETRVVVVDTVFLLLIGSVLLARRAPYAWRAWTLVLVPWLLGLFFLVGFGFSAAGFLFVMAFPIMGAVLLGLRTGVYCIGAAMLSLAALGVLIPAGVYSWSGTMPPGMPSASVMWVVNSMSVFMLSALTTFSIGVLFDGLGDEASARRTAEEESARLAAAVEQSENLVVLLDRAGAARYANRAARALLGADAGSLLRDLAATVWRGDAWAGRFELPFSSGSTLTLSGTLSPVRDVGGDVQFVLASLRDVRRERALELRLQQGQKLEAIGTLAGGIAHDFNNLLQPIVLNAESAQALLDQTHDAQPLLHDIRQAADRARALVRRILTFTRGVEHDRRSLDLGALVLETERMLRTTLPASVRLVTRVEPGVVVVAEPGEVQQVLLNLATNAAHAMPQGGRLELVVERAPVSQEPTWLQAFPGQTEVAVLGVQDTGVGMDEETLRRAFEPFFTTKGPSRGTGLGLAMVHGTVTGLGGVVTPSSTVGAGTSMRVALPLASHAPTAESPSEATAVVAAARRLLLVDDEPAVLTATTRLLERLGWAVETCADGRAAEARVRQAGHTLDCVVTDLSMPGMSGLELAERIRALRPELPVVLATGFLDQEQLLRNDGATVQRVLTKPFSSAELQQALDAVVRT